jgi:hypothetical protein
MNLFDVTTQVWDQGYGGLMWMHMLKISAQKLKQCFSGWPTMTVS